MEQRIAVRKNPEQFLLGSGVKEELNIFSRADFALVDSFLEKNCGSHIFFILSYELGMQFLEVDPDPAKKRSELPLAKFWTAKSVYSPAELLEGTKNESFEDWFQHLNTPTTNFPQQWNWSFLNTKESYLEDVAEIQRNMQLGNCYELNYCQKIEANGALKIEGLELFKHLNEVTKAPHSAYFENKELILASGSPERFIQKTGNKLSSQPIKGTAPRGKTPEEDEQQKKKLLASFKDKTENVMIVDLVRNDCSKIASKGSVKVEEFSALHTFETVHQLISTISCDVKENTSFSEILHALFPMGSMTGAPKRTVVQLTEKIERAARNWYSGSIGVIEPNGDFDCNVLIRTLFYDKKNESISCMVGGAITHLSNPEEEWEECKTKVGKIIDRFGTCTW